MKQKLKNLWNYFTTYGYIKWTQYIKAHPKQPAALEPDRADNLV